MALTTIRLLTWASMTMTYPAMGMVTLVFSLVCVHSFLARGGHCRQASLLSFCG